MGLSMSFFMFMYLSFLLSFFQLTSSRQLLCHDNERIALLRFKESFVIRKLASSHPSAYPKAARWNLEENSDCCSWEGIKCNEDTGYVIKLDLTSSYLYGSLNSAGNTLFNLVHLQWLSLADNHFNDSKIPNGIKNLSNLSYLNLSYSVFSGEIPPEMLELSNLESLDLSYDLSYNPLLLHLQQPGLKSLTEKLINIKVLALDGVNISSSLPQALINLSSLKFLSLQHCNLLGTIPLISNLNSLIYLDLSNNYLQGTIPSINNLNSLTYLDLSNNYLQGTIISISNLSSLTHLDLSNNYLQGKISSSLGDITNLNHLDLSSNNFGGKISSSFGNLTSISYLDLSHNNFEGMLLSSLGYCNNLIHLDLSWNDFKGKILSSVGNLTNLEHLDMSCNSFSNPDPFSLTNLTHLNYLDLSSNNFSSPSSSLSWIGENTELTYLGLSSINIGEIPFWLLKMNQLSTIYLSSNQISGPIPPEIGNLTKLKNLYLSSNQLQGSIPSSIFELNNLEELYLSSNNLSGTIEFKTFLQLKSLSRLDLSSNRLSLLTNSTVNASSHKFRVLTLGSCNLKGFPDFLRDQDQLEWLDLSSNNITGQIPGWLLNISQYSLERLNLSHNLLIGFDHQPVVLLWVRLYSLDLNFNNLQSPLPIPPTSTLQVYLVSHNKMLGELQPWICKLNSLMALDLSNNNLSGKLPQCLFNFSQSMSVLNLQNNKFHGSIPQTFMNGTKLRMIELSNNMLQGKIPRSLANCTMLEVLDLGNNKISDTFPYWIGTLPNLKVLNLQLNQLYGEIEEPKSDFAFPKLQIIDLSQNSFMGKLPSKYFESWNAMKVVNTSQLAYMMKSSPNGGWYDYSIRMVNKRVVIEYEKISNTLVSISLSNNKFEGEIPTSISTLKGLRYLNISNNNLVGGIPSCLGNLTLLESLDLSYNSLQGEIPQLLVKLTFLAFFDVSYNNLIGTIPQGAQLNTFNNNSYKGNPGLCGPPLSKKCGNSELPQKEDDRESESSFAFGWKEVAIGYASGLIIGVVLGHVFCTRKHAWFVKIFGMPLKRVKRKRGRHNN